MIDLLDGVREAFQRIVADCADRRYPDADCRTRCELIAREALARLAGDTPHDDVPAS